MPVSVAAYIASRVCRALDYAHNFIGPDGKRLDIVHRDVSPNNVMATWDGHIKLADFGIAKANTSIDPMAESPLMMMGKKHYMSPEQMLALPVDSRSDVFAVGVTLFELLAGQPLFREDVTELVIDEVTWRPMPGIRAHVPTIPVAIEDVLTLALDRDPSRRPTAAALGKALDRWCESQTIVATPDRLQSTSRRSSPQLPAAHRHPGAAERAYQLLQLQTRTPPVAARIPQAAARPLSRRRPHRVPRPGDVPTALAAVAWCRTFDGCESGIRRRATKETRVSLAAAASQGSSTRRSVRRHR
jgi:serine/threonine protein kinase